MFFQKNFSQFDMSNPAPRCPVVLLLDISGSMCGTPISELNNGLRQFIRETSQDEVASMSVELEIITFDSQAQVLVPFSPITEVSERCADLKASGLTSMGQALELADKDLKQQRKLYRQNGISAYRPWVILMTDGGPNDNWQGPAQSMKMQGERGDITFLGIEIGDRCDHDTLCQIVPDVPGPIKLKGLKFRQFFKWLTDSLNSVSASALSEQNNVQLPDASPWVDGLDDM